MGINSELKKVGGLGGFQSLKYWQEEDSSGLFVEQESCSVSSRMVSVQWRSLLPFLGYRRSEGVV